MAYGRSLDERKLPEAALAVYERCLLGNPGVADLHRLAFAAAFAANVSGSRNSHQRTMNAIRGDGNISSISLPKMRE